MQSTERCAATNKANFNALVGLAAKALEGIGQLTALNLQFVKAGLGEATATGLAALSAKDPQALLTLHSAMLQPAAEKATAYGRHVYGIVAAIVADVEKIAGEQARAAQSSLVALTEAAGKAKRG
jgi:phasin family protein